MRSAPSVDEFLKFLDDELDTITLFSVTKKLCQKWSLVPAIELDELWIGVEVPDGRKFANAISFRTYISGSLRVSTIIGEHLEKRRFSENGTPRPASVRPVAPLRFDVPPEPATPSHTLPRKIQQKNQISFRSPLAGKLADSSNGLDRIPAAFLGDTRQANSRSYIQATSSASSSNQGPNLWGSEEGVSDDVFADTALSSLPQGVVRSIEEKLSNLIFMDAAPEVVGVGIPTQAQWFSVLHLERPSEDYFAMLMSRVSDVTTTCLTKS